MMSNGGGSWMMGGIWLLPILFWILVIAGVVLIVRWLTARDGQGKVSSEESPLDILKTRYAKGEMDKETFETMKREENGNSRENWRENRVIAGLFAHHGMRTARIVRKFEFLEVPFKQNQRIDHLL